MWLSRVPFYFSSRSMLSRPPGTQPQAIYILSGQVSSFRAQLGCSLVQEDFPDSQRPSEVPPSYVIVERSPILSSQRAKVSLHRETFLNFVADVLIARCPCGSSFGSWNILTFLNSVFSVFGHKHPGRVSKRRNQCSALVLKQSLEFRNGAIILKARLQGKKMGPVSRECVATGHLGQICCAPHDEL